MIFQIYTAGRHGTAINSSLVNALRLADAFLLLDHPDHFVTIQQTVRVKRLFHLVSGVSFTFSQLITSQLTCLMRSTVDWPTSYGR